MDHTAGEESGTFSSPSTSHELVETKLELQNASWTWSGSRTPKACKGSSVSAGGDNVISLSSSIVIVSYNHRLYETWMELPGLKSVLNLRSFESPAGGDSTGFNARSYVSLWENDPTSRLNHNLTKLFPNERMISVAIVSKCSNTAWRSLSKLWSRLE